MGNGTGGLVGLVEKFNSQGLGDAMSSWISTGENQPVSGEQIINAFGTETIKKISSALGVSDAEASRQLAALIPQVIDRLTPDGTVPKGGLLERGLHLLKQKFLG